MHHIVWCGSRTSLHAGLVRERAIANAATTILLTFAMEGAGQERPCTKAHVMRTHGGIMVGLAYKVGGQFAHSLNS